MAGVPPLQSGCSPTASTLAIFYNQAQMSSMNILQVAVVMGSRTWRRLRTGHGRRDRHREGQRNHLPGGPPLVKAATGEVVSAEDLGGADVHCRNSGVTDYYARSDEHGVALARRIVANLNRSKPRPADADPEAPVFDPREMDGIIPADSRKQFDVRKVLARMVDGSRFDEFKELYGSTLVTGWAHIHGYRVGTSPTTACSLASRRQGAHFMMWPARHPLLFVQNITGFMVGRKYENEGIANMAQMVTAVATAPVPKLTMIIGGSFGAGNYGILRSRGDPRFLFMWPNASGNDDVDAPIGSLSRLSSCCPRSC